MCYQTSQQKEISIIKKVFQLPVKNESQFQQAFQLNGFAQPFLPVISTLDTKSIDLFRWKLIPTWVNSDTNWKANTLNARSEELLENATFKNYWNNRCAIICTGFFEPHLPLGEKKSQSYYIKPKVAEFFTLGGIFSNWNGIHTFSIVMVVASPLMAEIHNEKKRMPLILEGDDLDAWLLSDLSKDEMKDLMKTNPNDQNLESYRVMDGVMNPRMDTNVPEVIQPYKGSSQAIQGTLF